MSPNPIVAMLYLELGMFLAGLGCLTVARMLEALDEAAPAARDELRGERRGVLLARLGT